MSKDSEADFIGEFSSIDIVAGRATLSFANLLQIESGKKALTLAEFEKLRVINRVADFGGDPSIPLYEQQSTTLTSMFTALLREGPFNPFENENKSQDGSKRIITPLILKYPDDIRDFKDSFLINRALRSAIDKVSPKMLPNFETSLNPEIDRQFFTTIDGLKVFGESLLNHELRHVEKWRSISGKNCFIYMDFRYFVKDESLYPKSIKTMYEGGQKYVSSSLAPRYPSKDDVKLYANADPETKRRIIEILSKKPIWSLIKNEHKEQFINQPNSTINFPMPLPDGRTEIAVGEIFAYAMLELFSKVKNKNYSIVDVLRIVRAKKN